VKSTGTVFKVHLKILMIYDHLLAHPVFCVFVVFGVVFCYVWSGGCFGLPSAGPRRLPVFDLQGALCRYTCGVTMTPSLIWVARGRLASRFPFYFQSNLQDAFIEIIFSLFYFSFCKKLTTHKCVVIWTSVPSSNLPTPLTFRSFNHKRVICVNRG